MTFERALEHVDAELRAERTNAYALLVQRGGKTIFERYYGSTEPGDALQLRSATKSVLAALVSIAMDDGLLGELDQPVDELFPEHAGPQTAGLTVDHLLTMTAGFEWDDWADWRALYRTEDWVAETLRGRRVHDPGQVFAYHTGLSQVLAAALARRTGGTLRTFAQRRLFDPLGIATPRWERDPSGVEIGGFGLQLTARDFAKLGQLYLQRGRWEGTQLIAPERVAAAGTQTSAGGFPDENPYGRHWWVTDESGRHAFYAAGYGGQYAYVVPSLEMVVVTMGDPSLPPEDARMDLRGPIVDLVRAA